MPLEAGFDQPLNAIGRQFLEVDVRCICSLFAPGIPLDSCRCARRGIHYALGLPVACGHRLHPGLSVVALDPADRHECPKGIEQVLGEDGAGDQAAEPVDAAPVVVGVWSGRLKAVVAGEPAEIEARLQLRRHHHPVTDGHLLHERPDLGRPVDQGLGLLVRETLLQRPDQGLPIRKSTQIHIQAIPGHIHAPLIQELLLVLAARTGADQPEGHGTTSSPPTIPLAISYSLPRSIPASSPGSSSWMPT